MKFNLIQTKEILDFEKENNLELIINERPSHFRLPKYYASFKNTEVMENGCLSSEFGNGDTIDEAITNYGKNIECKRLAIDSHSDYRREVVCPKFIHSKLLDLTTQ
jgi:hypothetical protein